MPKIFWKWQTRFLWRWNQVENCSGSWWDRPVVIKCFFISYTTCQDDDDDDAVKLAYLFTRVPVVYSCSSLDFFSNNFLKINGTKTGILTREEKKRLCACNTFFSLSVRNRSTGCVLRYDRVVDEPRRQIHLFTHFHRVYPSAKENKTWNIIYALIILKCVCVCG